MNVGAKFDSDFEFDRAFRDFQVATNILFVTKASKTVDVVNSRLFAGLTKLGSKLKFTNITYVCKHGGVVRKTGTGLRPQQRTMKKDCMAKIIVTARRASQLLEVTVVNLEHNHEVSSETYKAYSECRQLNEEVNFVRPLIELNVRPSLIVKKLRQENWGTSNADSSQEERASAEPGEVYSSENPIETAQEAEWLHFPSSQDNMEDCSSVIQGEHQKRPVRRSMTSQTSIGLKKMRSLVAATKTLRRKCSRLKEMNSNLHSQLEKLKKDFFEMKALAEANGALTLQVRSYVSGRMLY
ncbi:hypothetical protein MRX96_049418 [Rhipicephalus microplus]